MPLGSTTSYAVSQTHPAREFLDPVVSISSHVTVEPLGEIVGNCVATIFEIKELGSKATEKPLHRRAVEQVFLFGYSSLARCSVRFDKQPH